MSEKNGCGECRSKKDCDEPVKGCGKCCSGGCHNNNEVFITQEERAFMLHLSQIPFLPLVRFKMSAGSSEAEAVALAPVYMNDGKESMETVKKTGELLLSLESKGLITLDYDIPLKNYDYSVFLNSGLYEHFCDTVREGKNREGFLFDTPELDYGSIALTSLGREVRDSLDVM